MLNPAEVRRSLGGALLLFRGRADGLAALDRSLEGFWRSFAAIFLILPINALTIFAVAKTTEGAAFSERFWGGLPLMALDWVLFPALLAAAAGSLGVSRNYVSYVVARNWASPVAAAIMMVPSLLAGAGWLGEGPTAFLSLLALGVVLRFHYLIVRIALGTAVALSIAVVAADLALTLLLVTLLG